MTQVEFVHDGVTLVSGGTDGTRYWDVQSGEVTSVLEASMFAFSKVSSREEKVGKFLITAEGDILLIFKSEGGVKDKTDKDTGPVAFFRAPSPIVTVDTSVSDIAVGCQNGEVLLIKREKRRGERTLMSVWGRIRTVVFSYRDFSRSISGMLYVSRVATAVGGHSCTMRCC